MLVPSGHAAAGGSCTLPVSIEIHDLGTGQAPYTLSQGDLASVENPNSQTVSTKSSPNGPVSNNWNITCGISLPDLLGQVVGLSRSSANYVGLSSVAGAGPWETLDQSEIWSPGSQFISGQVPLIWNSGDQLDYLRPLLAGDPSDSNQSSQVVTDGTSPLQLYVGAGTLLAVDSRVATKPNKEGNYDFRSPVTFAASATPDNTSPTYTWQFSDGTTEQGATVSHTFSQPGAYTVNVTAASSDGSGGAAEPLSIQVGNKPPSSTPSPTSTPTRGSSGSPNPGHSGGTHSPSPSPGTSGDPSPTPTPTPSVPHINLPPFSQTGPGGTSLALPPVIAPTGPLGVVLSPGTLVEGRIINDADASTLRSGTDGQSLGAATTRPLSTRRTVIAVGAGVIVIMLLFAAGAARESRGAGRRRSVGGPR